MGAVFRRVAPTPWSLLIFQGHRRCLAADSVIGLEPVGESPLPGAHIKKGGPEAALLEFIFKTSGCDGRRSRDVRNVITFRSSRRS